MRALTIHKLGGLVVSTVLSAGCASIATGGKQTLTIESEPSGAEIVFQGNTLATTPAQVQVPRERAGVLLNLRKEGYHDAQVRPATSTSGWFFGNIIFGGLIGSTIDIVSGASVEYAPDSYLVSLTPDEAQDRSASPYHIPVSQRAELKSYILVAFEPLVDDLLIGHGRHLETLYRRLGVAEDDQAAALQRLRSILTLSDGDVLVFANQILRYFPPPQEPQPVATPKPAPTPSPKPGDNWRSGARSGATVAPSVMPSPSPTGTPAKRFF